jgi:hypothetical protein
MTEDFLHFIWKYGLFDRSSMISESGEVIEVINLGVHNTDAGPDFLNARIKIGNTIWAGNVEIHLNSSDWYLHGHQQNNAYNNVVLHVVLKNDRPVERSTGEIIPCVELLFSNTLYANYFSLVNRQGFLPCMDKIRNIDPFLLDMWLNSLVVERLEQKTAHIAGLLDLYTNNWEECFYINLARSFGFGLNALPFEMTARSLPLMILYRHRDNLMQAECLLMGQAGFFTDDTVNSGYYAVLKKEYLHLQHKYQLKPVEKHLWKFLRLRPVNFPCIRISQFAMLMCRSEKLFSQITECHSISELRQLFEVKASAYWDSHYTFETDSPNMSKSLGDDAFHTLVINAVIPFLFCYGNRNSREELKMMAIDWMNQIPPEKNRIIKHWLQSGIKPSSALYSQGLLQLYTNFCNRKRCLACSIGAKIITSPHALT